MKISTKGRYALRLMLDIARQGEGAVVSLSDVSGRQGVSVKYLEQLVMRLTKCGYLKSIRGVQGGYRLTKQPEEYTVGDILRVMEGDLAPVSCLADGETVCPRRDQCESLWFWQGLDEAVTRYVDSYTLADFLTIRNS